MIPPFFLQIDEIGESPNAVPRNDINGLWIPSTDPGAHCNILAGPSGRHISGRHWFCNSQRIYEVTQRPANAPLYKTFSVYYVGGSGFHILRGDARYPPGDDGFHKLQFSCHNNDLSSYLTNAGQQHTLYRQPQDPRWAHMLLPNIYHSHEPAPSPQYGGLVGELPIFLALMAFTTSREYIPNVLPHLLVNGAWVTAHQWQMQQMDRRGLVVSVYTCPADFPENSPAGWTGSTGRSLYDCEMGVYGKYFY